MEKVYRAFKERQAQRRKALAYLFAFLMMNISLGAYLHFYVEWLYEVWFPLGFLSVVFSFIYIMSRSWAQERVETKIFINMYEASNLLELCSREDDASFFYSRKATGKVRNVIRSLGGLQHSLEKILSKLFTREFAEPLRQLKENLATIILPRIARHKDVESMIQVLRGLAKLFSEAEKPISLDDIIAKSKDLERYKLIEDLEEPMRFRDHLSMFFSAHKFLKHGLVVSTVTIGCCVFYYMVVSYLEISKEYAFTGSVAIFLGFLTIYFTKQPR